MDLSPTSLPLYPLLAPVPFKVISLMPHLRHHCASNNGRIKDASSKIPSSSCLPPPFSPSLLYFIIHYPSTISGMTKPAVSFLKITKCFMFPTKARSLLPFFVLFLCSLEFSGQAVEKEKKSMMRKRRGG